jgi:hypothetical protein
VQSGGAAAVVARGVEAELSRSGPARPMAATAAELRRPGLTLCREIARNSGVNGCRAVRPTGSRAPALIGQHLGNDGDRAEEDLDDPTRVVVAIESDRGPWVQALCGNQAGLALVSAGDPLTAARKTAAPTLPCECRKRRSTRRCSCSLSRCCARTMLNLNRPLSPPTGFRAHVAN